MNATQEKQNKRRNLIRWQIARLRRLDHHDLYGAISDRQTARLAQLRRAIERQSS